MRENHHEKLATLLSHRRFHLANPNLAERIILKAQHVRRVQQRRLRSENRKDSHARLIKALRCIRKWRQQQLRGSGRCTGRFGSAFLRSNSRSSPLTRLCGDQMSDTRRVLFELQSPPMKTREVWIVTGADHAGIRQALASQTVETRLAGIVARAMAPS